MPFAVRKVKGGYKVKNLDTGKYYSKKAQTKTMADKQLKAISVNYYGKKKKK
jgi:hypothetical protein